jgi:hypothetical protein
VEVEDKLISRLGIHQTGCVMGALRMMQGWNFASALVEVRIQSKTAHITIAVAARLGRERSVEVRRSTSKLTEQYQSHSGQSKHRIADEHYIEVRQLPPF